MLGRHLSSLPSVLMLLGFLSLLFFNKGAARKRRSALPAMAERMGLQSRPENVLPPGMQLEATPFKKWSRVFNGYEGVLNGVPVVVFDLNINKGKASWSRTLVGVRRPAETAALELPGLEAKHCGPWLVYYKPLGFWQSGGTYTAAEELEALLRTLTGEGGERR